MQPELWIEDGREDRLVQCLDREAGAALVIAPDRDAVARWARKLDATPLDSGVTESERRRAGFAASRGRAPVVVGTRSALLPPLPRPATLALIDAHDPAHKPPGRPGFPRAICSCDAPRSTAAASSCSPPPRRPRPGGAPRTARSSATRPRSVRGLRSSPPTPAASC